MIRMRRMMKMCARNPPEVEPPSGVTSRKAHTGEHIYMHSSPILINMMMMMMNDMMHHPSWFSPGAGATFLERSQPIESSCGYSFSVRTTAVHSIIGLLQSQLFHFGQKSPKSLQPLDICKEHGSRTCDIIEGGSNLFLATFLLAPFPL